MYINKAAFHYAMLLVLLIFLKPSYSCAEPLDNWHVRYSHSGGYALNAVAYGNGMFVAVGNNGLILSSTDGADWLPCSSGITAELTGVAYGAGMFVTVGRQGTILNSTDGINWVLQVSGSSANIDSVAYGNNLFIALTTGNNHLASTNGVNWTPHQSYYMRKITFGDGAFWALGTLGGLYMSSDGIVWSFRPVILSGPAGEYSGIAVHKGTYVIVGVNEAPGITLPPACEKIWRSANGTNWIQARNGPCDSMFLGITYGNNYFMAVGPQGSIYSSPDGFIWTERKTGAADCFTSIVYGNNTFVAVGYYGTILQSDPVEKVVGVPTLSGWGMILLFLFCGIIAVRSISNAKKRTA